jgi:NodT family efflux transporter outer membrane factor (OMF) lipoprotein
MASAPLCRIVLIVTAAALAACSTSPAYQRPPVATPDTWRQADSKQSAAWPAADWWTTYGSPQLDALISQALRQNFDLAAAIARMQQADAQMRIAGAALLPSVGAGGEVSRERQPATSSRSGASETSTLQRVSLNASYELDFWGKNRAALKSAKASALASQYDRDTVALSVTSAVATTYFQILALHDRLAVSNGNLKDAQEILTILRARLAAGIATALDVAQQETTVATLSATLPPLQTQLQRNLDTMAILVGQLPERFDVAPGSLADLQIPDVTPGLPSELVSRRPDVAEAEAQLVGANADIAAARAAFFPSFQLTAEGGYESAALASSLGPASALFTLAANITQPIFQGGRLRGQYHLSRARYDELLQMYRKSVVSAFADVEDSLAATRQTGEQETRQARAAAAARRAHDISVAQLRAGTADQLAVLTAQNALFNAEDALVQVKLARLQASIDLFQALGGGWQTPRGGS